MKDPAAIVWLKGGACTTPSPCTIGICCAQGSCLPGLTRGECLMTGFNYTFHTSGSCDPNASDYACKSGRMQIISTLRGAYSQEDRNVQLQWDRETFFNSGTEFTVERSRDGQNFKPIGFVEGNATTADGYSFTDNYPYQVGHYRLTFFSTTGKAYSQIITAVAVNNDKLYLMPNPATTTLRVLLSNMQSYETELSVHDLSGRQLRSYKLSKGQNEISVSGLLQGTYVVKARMNGNTYTSRFVKN